MDIDLIKLSEKVYQKVIKEVTEAYSNNQIDVILKKYDLLDEIEYSYHDLNKSKILVIGNSVVDKNELVLTAKKYGINENRLEFLLDFSKLSTYDFSILKDNMNYSDILIGPIPHKVKRIDGYSSLIAMIEDNPKDYPKLIKLESSNELKITKQTFKEGIINSRLYHDLYC